MTQLKLKLPKRREMPAIRRAQIIEAALRLARSVGSQGLIRDRIAEEAKLSSALIHKHCGGMDYLREVVIRTAFERADVDVLYKSLSIEDFKKLNTNPVLAKQLCEYIMM